MPGSLIELTYYCEHAKLRKEQRGMKRHGNFDNPGSWPGEEHGKRLVRWRGNWIACSFPGIAVVENW
jgi:hypothetical protein